MQWARKGVRVNAICPGWFATEMTSDMVGTEKGDELIATHTPIPRAGEPHELDGPLLLLASDASSFMTGPCSWSTAAGPPADHPQHTAGSPAQSRVLWHPDLDTPNWR